jgi:signal transduction histidine kinase
LKIMRERAEAFSGTLNIGTSRKNGAKVEAIIPVEGLSPR